MVYSMTINVSETQFQFDYRTILFSLRIRIPPLYMQTRWIVRVTHMHKAGKNRKRCYKIFSQFPQRPIHLSSGIQATIKPPPTATIPRRNILVITVIDISSCLFKYNLVFIKHYHIAVYFYEIYHFYWTEYYMYMRYLINYCFL